MPLSPFSKVHLFPTFSGTTSSLENASSSALPLLFVSVLSQSTTHALKSPAMATGEYFLASSVSLSRKSMNSLVYPLGGA